MARAYGAPQDLSHLEEEARVLALRRETIQRQLDGMFPDGALAADQLSRLDHLEEEERRLSAERRALHQRIAHLRAGLGLEQHERWSRKRA